MLQIVEVEEEEKAEVEVEVEEEDAEVIRALNEQVKEVAFDIEKAEAEAAEVANDVSLEVKALNEGGNDDAPIDPDDEREFSVYSFDSADYKEGPINEANIPDVGTCIPSGCSRNLQRGSNR